MKRYPVLLCAALLAAPGHAATLRETVKSQQLTIERLEKQLARQGALLEKLECRMDAKPALPPSPAPVPAPKPPAGPPAPDPMARSIDAIKASDPNTMVMKYADNMTGETLDRNHRIFVGGRLQFDAVGVHADDAVERVPGGLGAVQDGVNIRRARLDIGGTLYRNLDFYSQFDFVNQANTERVGASLLINSPAPTDLWLQFKSLPAIGNLRVGNQKQWLGFEHMISSRFLDFMERSSAFDAFAEEQDNGFKLGVNAFNVSKDEQMTWALGVFKNNRGPFGSNLGDGEHVFTGRVSYAPVYRDGGRELVHVALGGSYGDLDDDETRFRTRILLRNGSNAQHTIVADARLGGDHESRLVPEVAVVRGPFTFQGEYYRAGVTDARLGGRAGTPIGDVSFDGYYAQVMYFLTGEHKSYSRKSGSFGRVVPKRNADWGPGTLPAAPLGGAWMLAFRHGGVNLNDGLARFGRVHDDTFGVNWFLDPAVKVQWNYTRTYRDAPATADGAIDSFGTRLAFDF